MTRGHVLAAGCMPLLIACGMPPSDGGGVEPAGTLPGNLRLVVDSGRCVANAELNGAKQAIDLDLPAPCSFGKQSDGSVRVVPVGKHRYVIVEAAEPKVGGRCRTSYRSMRFGSGGWRASQVRGRKAACVGTHWDGAVFEGSFK